MLVEILKPDFEFEDHRGSLKQLFHKGWKQVNIIQSFSGILRGGHFHKNNKEAFYIIQGSVVLQLEKDGFNETYSFSSRDMFIIEPYVFHTFVFQEDTILVSMYDLGVGEGEEKDIYTK